MLVNHGSQLTLSRSLDRSQGAGQFYARSGAFSRVHDGGAGFRRFVADTIPIDNMSYDKPERVRRVRMVIRTDRQENCKRGDRERMKSWLNSDGPTAMSGRRAGG